MAGTLASSVSRRRAWAWVVRATDTGRGHAAETHFCRNLVLGIQNVWSWVPNVFFPGSGQTRAGPEAAWDRGSDVARDVAQDVARDVARDVTRDVTQNVASHGGTSLPHGPGRRNPFTATEQVPAASVCVKPTPSRHLLFKLPLTLSQTAGNKPISHHGSRGWAVRKRGSVNLILSRLLYFTLSFCRGYEVKPAPQRGLGWSWFLRGRRADGQDWSRPGWPGRRPPAPAGPED